MLSFCLRIRTFTSKLHILAFCGMTKTSWSFHKGSQTWTSFLVISSYCAVSEVKLSTPLSQPPPAASHFCTIINFSPPRALLFTPNSANNGGHTHRHRHAQTSRRRRQNRFNSSGEVGELSSRSFFPFLRPSETRCCFDGWLGACGRMPPCQRRHPQIPQRCHPATPGATQRLETANYSHLDWCVRAQRQGGLIGVVGDVGDVRLCVGTKYLFW